MYDLNLYIPTRGRINSQKTIEHLEIKRLQQDSVLRCMFVVPTCEKSAFRRTYPWARLREVPDEFRYGDIIQYIAELDGRRKIILDDDMHLIRRRIPTQISQKGGVATSLDVDELMERINYWMDQGYVHGGISLRQTNHFCVGKSCKFNTRVSGMFFFDADVLNAEQVKFNAVQERSDFHVTLSLLELGYCNVCDYEFAVGQYLAGTNSPGGCSRYRDPAFLLSQAERLQLLHPEAVRVIFKSRKSKDVESMKGDLGIPDVRIQWARVVGIRADNRRYSGDLSNLQLSNSK